MIDDFERRGINFVSITEQFDTTTPTGKFVVTMFIAMAQLERDVIVMRTKAGLEAARKAWQSRRQTEGAAGQR